MSVTAPPSITGTAWSPTTVTPWVRALAVASLLANSLLVLTGGLVRLTGSGLGCPTWPRCSAESWTNTPEMGVHGIIEFGNRLLTFVLAAVAVLTFLSVLRLRHEFPRLFRLALVLGLGIPLQAVVGGITVWVQLHPLVVGIHYFISAVMICLSTLLVLETRRIGLSAVALEQRTGQAQASRTVIRGAALVMAALTMCVLYLGTLVTGTGVHAGDEDSARLAFAPRLITFLHVVPVYLLVATVVGALLIGAVKQWPRVLRRAHAVVAGVLVAQALVGYYQYLNNVPIPAVALHLVLSAVTVWAVTRAVSISFHITRHSSEADVARTQDLGSDATARVN